MQNHRPAFYRNALAEIVAQQGQDGSQSGYGQRGQPHLDPFENQRQQMPMRGAMGTQSGVGDESAGNSLGRITQGLSGMGIGVGGMGLGGMMGFGMGDTLGGLPGGILGAVKGGEIGATPGIGVMENSMSPNPHDVWLNQMVQRMRRYNRGLDQE